MSPFPFEVSYEEILRDPDVYVDAVFSCLESEFLVMPKGTGFIDYPVFERGYEALKTATREFSRLEPANVLAVILKEPISIVVLRTMLGFTPSEWSYLTTQRTGIDVTQGFVRSLDRKVRMAPETSIRTKGMTKERITALVDTACHLLLQGVPKTNTDRLHRLDKADTRGGIESIRNLAGMGVPYAMLLYERFLGAATTFLTSLQMRNVEMINKRGRLQMREGTRNDKKI